MSAADQLVAIGRQLTLPGEWTSPATSAVIGKDILELLSTAMYIEPRSIFREYIQNAADSIDEARRTGLIEARSPGLVTIDMNHVTRSIKIRDNGVGLADGEFEQRLTAFGASVKRGTGARGFRGVGRLAGLGYCQELIFRSRMAGASQITELKWDCRKLRSLLRDNTFSGHLVNLVDQTVTKRSADGRNWPEHFFEVELVGIVRHRNDQLLNAIAVEEYLAQVGPVPFAPEFRYGQEITAALEPHLQLSLVEIRVNNSIDPIYRPHRNTLDFEGQTLDRFTDLELVQIPAVDGRVAAIGWVLHHGYAGALPANSRVRGLRMRSGDIQIGGDDLLQDLFPEPRFNSWSVGELHLLDHGLVPNGRRDHLEQNVHLDNLMNHMSPVAREISRRCRISSLRRKWLRDFTRYENSVNDRAAILKQRSLNRISRGTVVSQIEESLASMDRILMINDLDAPTRDSLNGRVRALRDSLRRLLRSAPKKTVLAHLPPARRRAYEQMVALIYECSPNQSTAKVLVDKILTKLK